MTSKITISIPQQTDPLVAGRRHVNKKGRFSFGEKIANCLRGLISLVKNIFLGSVKRSKRLGLEMISTGTSKLERTVKPLWADDEAAIRQTLKNGDILIPMGKEIDPVVSLGQFLSKPITGSVPTSDTGHYCEHTCMYVRDDDGKEWIIEASPPWFEKGKNKKLVKLLGDGARKVPFEEHGMFLQFRDQYKKYSRFEERQNRDLFIKVVRLADPNLAEEAARVASKWSSVSRVNLDALSGKIPSQKEKRQLPVSTDLVERNTKGEFNEQLDRYIVQPSKEMIKLSEDSFILGYAYLKAGLSIFLSTSDNDSKKKEFLKWALLSNYPPKRGDPRISSQFCTMFTTWTLRVAESKKIVRFLLDKHPKDQEVQLLSHAVSNPKSDQTSALIDNSKKLNKLVDSIYSKYKKDIQDHAAIQLRPMGTTPSKFFDYAKANPNAFQQVATIIPRNHPSLPNPVGKRVG